MSSTPTKLAQDFAAVRDWPGYFQAVLGKPARETLLKALELFEGEQWGEDKGRHAGPFSPGKRRVVLRAIDLGCGEGRDTFELLNRGWSVLAIDDHLDAFGHLLPRVASDQRARLDMRAQSFEAMTLPLAHLVNASFSLPFCAPQAFPRLWQEIRRAIIPGGRFAGQFFGDHDTWATLPDRSHQTEGEVRELLDGFDIEMWQMEDRPSKTATGLPKHWHVFHVVAKKRG